MHSRSSSVKGPAVSSEVKTVHPKFLFKQKTATVFYSPPKTGVESSPSPPHGLVRKTAGYVIPQRRNMKKTESLWTPKQSADCETDDDEASIGEANDDEEPADEVNNGEEPGNDAVASADTEEEEMYEPAHRDEVQEIDEKEHLGGNNNYESDVGTSDANSDVY